TINLDCRRFGEGVTHGAGGVHQSPVFLVPFACASRSVHAIKRGPREPRSMSIIGTLDTLKPYAPILAVAPYSCFRKRMTRLGKHSGDHLSPICKNGTKITII